MNAKLIESLAQIIQSLAEEERLLLEKKLVAHETQTDWLFSTLCDNFCL